MTKLEKEYDLRDENDSLSAERGCPGTREDLYLPWRQHAC